MSGGCPYATMVSSDDEGSVGSSTRLSKLRSSCPAFAESKCPFQDATTPEQMKKMISKMPHSHFQMDAGFYKMMESLHDDIQEGPVSGRPPRLPKLTTSIVSLCASSSKEASSSSSLSPSVHQQFSTFVSGGCPMKSYLDEASNDSTGRKSAAAGSLGTSRVNHRISFNAAMENLSLPIILARLAEEFQDRLLEEDKEIMISTNENCAEDKGITISTTTPNSSSMPSLDISLDDTNEKGEALAEALKMGTAISHQAAEDVHFVRNFIRGKIDRELFARLVLSMYHVYLVLEESLEEHAPHHFALCHFPDELFRTDALREDVEFWHGKVPEDERKEDNNTSSCSPATSAYLDRIRYLSKYDPLLLLAHSYTRYMGDLSGGKILERVARRALHLGKDGDDGLAFYRFEKISSPKVFKDGFRKALDDLNLNPKQIQKLVVEANIAFCLNMRIFQELDVLANIPGAAVMSLEDTFSFYQRHVNINQENDANSKGGGEEKCPFLVSKKELSSKAISKTTSVPQGRCPWPFVFAHDPLQGMSCWQTWVTSLIFLLFLVWRNDNKYAYSFISAWKNMNVTEEL